MNKFDCSGDVRDEQRNGRRIVATSEETVNRVRTAVNGNLLTSRHRLATRLGISPGSVGRCLKKQDETIPAMVYARIAAGGL